MTDRELEELLAQPLPVRDAGEFSVALMEAIARSEARTARLLSWISLGVLAVVISAACVFGAVAAEGSAFGGHGITIPAALTLLTLLLSFVALRSARE